MKRKLQCISLGVALLTVMIACDKDKSGDSSTNPPPQPIDSLGRCDNSNRVKVSAQLILIGKLSQARSGIAVVAVDNKILYAGGLMKDDDSVSSRVDIYDVAANSWSRAELSQARGGIAAVAAGNKVFFAGGYVNNGAMNETYATVDIYDITTNLWSVAHLSQPRSYIAAAAVGDKVLFAGGEDAEHSATYTVDVYDLSIGSWSITQLSEGWSNIKAITLNDKIYFAGGYRLLPNGGDYESSNLIHIYDYATNFWSTATLRYPMGALTGVAVADNIYWAAECLVEIKNVQTGNSTSASLFTSAYWLSVEGQSAVVKNNKLIFFRHNSGKEAWFDIYDIATNAWYIGEVSIKVPLASIISVNNTIYLAGGVINDAFTDQVWTLEF